MDKRTKAKLEREKLKQMMDNNPRLVKFLESAVDTTNLQEKALKDLIEPVLHDNFERIRMQGIQTGWLVHAVQCKKKIEKCKTLEEAIEVMDNEARETAEKLHINYEEYEDTES